MTQPPEPPRCQVDAGACRCGSGEAGHGTMSTPHAYDGLRSLPLECVTCGHGREHHGQEREFYECDGSRREVCLMCPGYVMVDEVSTGYPNGKAWHRFNTPQACPVHSAAPVTDGGNL